MGRYISKYSASSADVTLTYPTSSGTFALVSQLVGVNVSNFSGSRLLLSGPTLSDITASSALVFGDQALTISSSVETSSSIFRSLYLKNTSTGTPVTSSRGVATASFGVGISFEAENPTTASAAIGNFDYRWASNTASLDYSIASIDTADMSQMHTAKTFGAGLESSFHGHNVAATVDLLDPTGKHAEYRVYATGSTTDGTVTSMRFTVPDATVPGITIPTDTTWMYTAYVVGRRTDADNESAAYWIQGAMDNNAGVVAAVGTAVKTAIEDTVAWDATVTNVGTRLVIRVTGETSKTIKWNAVLHIIQVSG